MGPTLESVEARVAIDGRTVLDCGVFALTGERVLALGAAEPLVGALTGVPGSALTLPARHEWLETSGEARVVSGHLSVLGRDVARGDHRPILGTALCKAPVPEDVSPLEWLVWSAELAGVPTRAARELADGWAGRLSIPRGKRDRPAMLPRALRRVLSIAAGVVADPRVLVVDEPLEGLDPGEAGVVLAALGTVTSERASIVSARRVEPGAPSWALATGATDLLVIEAGEVMVAGSANDLALSGAAFSLVVLERADALREELIRAGFRVVGSPDRPTVLTPAGTRPRDVLACAERAGAALVRLRPLLG